MLTLAVALAAGLGSVCRYLLDRAVQRRTRRDWPLGTWVVNVSGSLLLGVVLGLGPRLGPATAAVLGAGFAGGFTTLSTWMWETLVLADSDRLRAAGANLVLGATGGILAAAAGLGLARLVGSAV